VGGGVFLFLSPASRGGALGGPGPVWVQLGPPLPPREGAVPDSLVQNKRTLIDSRRIRKEGERRRGGFSPSSRISWAMGPSRRMDRGRTR
jgi:hypothetical protein